MWETAFGESRKWQPVNYWDQNWDRKNGGILFIYFVFVEKKGEVKVENKVFILLARCLDTWMIPTPHLFKILNWKYVEKISKWLIVLLHTMDSHNIDWV